MDSQGTDAVCVFFDSPAVYSSGMAITACFFSIPMPLGETKELARGLRERDPALFDRLIEQYHYRLFRYLLYLTGNREAAEDVFQETWIRVLERGHQYDGKRRFETWLFTIARNLVIDVHRREAPAPFGSLDALDERRRDAGLEPVSTAPSPLDGVLQWEETVHLTGALQRLAPVYREALLLRFQEDMQLEEIALVISCPLSTVKSRLYRGLEALRQFLEEEK